MPLSHTRSESRDLRWSHTFTSWTWGGKVHTRWYLRSVSHRRWLILEPVFPHAVVCFVSQAARCFRETFMLSTPRVCTNGHLKDTLVSFTQNWPRDSTLNHDIIKVQEWWLSVSQRGRLISGKRDMLKRVSRYESVCEWATRLWILRCPKIHKGLSIQSHKLLQEML